MRTARAAHDGDATHSTRPGNPRPDYRRAGSPVGSVAAWSRRASRTLPRAGSRSLARQLARAPVAHDRHDRRVVPAQPRHRTGRRGRVLRRAVRAAAGLRARRVRSASSASSFTDTQIEDIRNAVLEVSRQALTERAVNRIIRPTIDTVLDGGRYDVISIGFILALWSGSRALNVFVDTITIMHGLGGHRGIVATRALSFVLYVLAMVTGSAEPPARGGRADAGRPGAPGATRLRQQPLLADRARALHLLPRHALPRVRAGADEVDASTSPARRSRCSAGSPGRTSCAGC